MGRQDRDPTISHSSIALLQERFKQLQKVKEMREEREMLRLFSETERISPTMRHEPSKLFIHPDAILPSGVPLHGSLSLRTNSQGKHGDFRTVETPVLMNLWHTNRASMHLSHNFEDADIDTSLHL